MRRGWSKAIYIPYHCCTRPTVEIPVEHFGQSANTAFHSLLKFSMHDGVYRTATYCTSVERERERERDTKAMCLHYLLVLHCIHIAYELYATVVVISMSPHAVHE